MQNRKPSGPVVDGARDIIESLGYSIVEFSAERVKGRTHVHCVLHRPAGISLDDLGEIHQTLQPRLEQLLEDDDLHIEFSSPGIGRTLKNFYEFSVFVGTPVRVLPADGNDWIEGVIEVADEGTCSIVDNEGTRHTFVPETVVKARLTD